MTNITLGVEQEITIRDFEGHMFSEIVTIVERVQEGVQARFPTPVEKCLTVELNTINYSPPLTRRKNGAIKSFSVEDRFMMSMT